MSNNLKVTLVPAGTSFVVDIDESGNANKVNRDPNPQTIRWILAGNASQGSMVKFAWLDPSPGSCGPAVPTPAKKRFKMIDLNDSAATVGAWRYQLTIKVDNKNYSTIADLSGATKKTKVTTLTTTNPSIVNK